MDMSIGAAKRQRKDGVNKLSWKRDFKINWLLYVLFIPAAAYFIVFSYMPMYGIQIAFKDFKISRGILGSAWVGLENFRELFIGETFWQVMRNTVSMALLNLTLGFIAPVFLAFILSEVRFKPYKRLAQTVSYMPYFIAAVVVSSLVREFLATDGAVTALLSLLGLPKQNWLANSNIPVFWLINCFTDIWQGAGYGAIIYIAAISNVRGELHEAAAIDGANRWKRLTWITLPNIMPMVVMMLTLRVGLVFVAGFDKVLLLYMPTTYATADVLTTYTYRMAFGSGTNYGLASASGLFQSVVGTVLLFASNWLNRRATKLSLF
jgi:ABC-type polysaccharide transport system permease subunit